MIGVLDVVAADDGVSYMFFLPNAMLKVGKFGGISSVVFLCI